jgi:hypothetical protein
VGGVLRLKVVGFAGPCRLTEAAGGRFVAEHDVVLNVSEWQCEAFTSLDGDLRWNADPDRWLASEAELTAQVGTCLGEQVLGPMEAALARDPQAVCLKVPEGPEVPALSVATPPVNSNPLRACTLSGGGRNQSYCSYHICHRHYHFNCAIANRKQLSNSHCHCSSRIQRNG